MQTPNSSAHSICFWVLQSVCEGWINEQERYYYFNRRHQEIKPCGRLCEWREEVRVCMFVYVGAHMYICRCVPLCATIWDGGRKELIYKNRRLRSWSKQKRERNSCMHIDTLAESLCDFVCACASDCLWSQKKRDLYFRAYALFSRTHTSTGLNISIINCDYALLGSFIYSFTLQSRAKHKPAFIVLGSKTTVWP